MDHLIKLMCASVAAHIKNGTATKQDYALSNLLMHLPAESVRPNNDRTVVVDKGYFYKPIDKDTPLGVKLQLCNSYYRAAAYGQLSSHEGYFNYWAPLPSFPEGVSNAQWRTS